MEITREFLLAEIRRLEGDRNQAQAFVNQSQGAIDGYKALIERLDAAPPFELMPDQPAASAEGESTCPT